MFSRVLVAIDRSLNSRIVFEKSLALAKATGARLLLLHVLSSDEEGSPRMPMITTLEYVPVGAEPLDNYWQQWQTYEKQGLSLLRSYNDEASEAGVSSEFTQYFGRPSREICAVARTWGADLIAIGRRGHFSLNELILGSVSNAVFHHAPCSVYVVHISVSSKPQLPVVGQSQLGDFEAANDDRYEQLIKSKTITEEPLSSEDLAHVFGGVEYFNHLTHSDSYRSIGREGNILEPSPTFPIPPRPEDAP